MEDSKNIKDDKKQKKSPELKEQLSEEELKGVDGGAMVVGYELEQVPPMSGITVHEGIGIER
ncbi:hypothetical protein SynBIOSE41_01681 [Synechococcus sp. BIOS-E4-1]|uniref:hypothetical protein n=1 Tax=Synechococcus sp. BIOS-E4-1 TaxID=1400864 RepID=UPI00164915D7|nr:hypothetical protein [Synechococcus sp. BIOS-E4-1]QNI54195.1 hypothetical protein SynBIOSE41_01681 [Synechococcus sp. BIOS-E4-1]